MAANENAGQALRPAKGGFSLIRLADDAARLKAQLDSSAADRAAESLVKDYGLNVTLMVLKRGARLHEHHTRGPLTVQVMSGRVNFVAAGTPNELAAGSMLALDRETPHSVEALEDSALLLTSAIG